MGRKDKIVKFVGNSNRVFAKPRQGCEISPVGKVTLMLAPRQI